MHCCSSKKSMQKTTVYSNLKESKVNYAFELSNFTKLFHSDLKKLMLDDSNEELPAEFVKKYQLVKMDGKYFAKGFIQIASSWSPQSLTDLGIKTVTSSGNMKTVSIPINQFDSFLGLSGINYFQLSETVNPKN